MLVITEGLERIVESEVNSRSLLIIPMREPRFDYFIVRCH